MWPRKSRTLLLSSRACHVSLAWGNPLYETKEIKTCGETRYQVVVWWWCVTKSFPVVISLVQAVRALRGKFRCWPLELFQASKTAIAGTFLTLAVLNSGNSFLLGLFNPLNTELNPICYLLALLGAHNFLHVSRIGIKSLTFRLLMSYIYIYGAPILDVSRSHTTTQHSW